MTRVPRTAVLLVVAVAAIVVGAACSPGQRPRPRPSVAPSPPAPDPAVDYGDPGKVCQAFAAALFRADTAVDAGPGEAYHRAAAYLNGNLAAAIAAQPSGVQTAGWQELASHRARVDVTVSLYAGDALPPDHDGERHHAVLADAVPVGRDGWQGQPRLHTIVCTLRPAGAAGWRVSDYEIG